MKKQAFWLKMVEMLIFMQKNIEDKVGRIMSGNELNLIKNIVFFQLEQTRLNKVSLLLFLEQTD